MDPTNIEATLTAIFGGSVIGGTVGSVTIGRTAAEWFRTHAKQRQDVNRAKELLGIRSDNELVYRHSSEHRLYVKSREIHPDNRDAITALAGSDFLRAQAQHQLSIVDTLLTDINANIALIGGPNSDGLTRIAFGYRPDGDPDSLSGADLAVDLPYRWVMSKAEIDEHAQASRYVAGIGRVTSPNW